MHRWSSAVTHGAFGGNWRLPRVHVPARRAAETGHDSFLLLRHAHQPYAPTDIGGKGVYLSPCDREEDWPKVERVFASESVETFASDWLYLGDYELVRAQPLSVGEIRSLPKDTLEHWVRHLKDKKTQDSWIRELHARVALRAQAGGHRTPSAAEVQEFLRMAPDLPALQMSEYRRALLNGDEKLYTFAMRCVRYQKKIPTQLLEAEREGLDDSEPGGSINISSSDGRLSGLLGEDSVRAAPIRRLPARFRPRPYNVEDHQTRRNTSQCSTASSLRSQRPSSVVAGPSRSQAVPNFQDCFLFNSPSSENEIEVIVID
ncbi:hypothetical protein OF83DRAFT_710652 [Amylostereum chailletii]|nr:hypothetical protein OF83DRAFT_710652 [Amylostereum chailletii]